MSVYDKKWTHENYKEHLLELGIFHHSNRKSEHDMMYCGWCKHAEVKNQFLDGWYLQSICKANDGVPVSEFCHCDKFDIDAKSKYWKPYKKQKKELLELIKERGN
jgi:hypothetical protein